MGYSMRPDPVKIAELKRLLSMAERLGYQDDVDHWTKELEKEQNGG